MTKVMVAGSALVLAMAGTVLASNPHPDGSVGDFTALNEVSAAVPLTDEELARVEGTAGAVVTNSTCIGFAGGACFVRGIGIVPRGTEIHSVLTPSGNLNIVAHPPTGPAQTGHLRLL